MQPEQPGGVLQEESRPPEFNAQLLGIVESLRTLVNRSPTSYVRLLTNIVQNLSTLAGCPGTPNPQVLMSLLENLNTLAMCFKVLYRQTGSLESLDTAIVLLRKGLLVHLPDADRFEYINDLAGVLWERYRLSGNVAELDESIQILETALTHCPTGHPLHAQTLNNLAICLQDRSTEIHSPSDMDRAIETHEAALVLRPKGHPDHPSSLTNLAVCLRNRFQARGTPEDLERAVAYSRAASDLQPEGHHLRPSSLSNLAICLQFRYQLHDAPEEDLQVSIQLLRTALTLYPPHHLERQTIQFNLAISLSYKFRRDGTITDLDESIDLLRPLGERRSFQHPLSLSFIDNLASCLKERHSHLSSLADLDSAIMYHSIAVQVCPHGHSERSAFLNNLGGSFLRRFELNGSLRDIELAIENHEAALALRPSGHLYRSTSLSNLGSCYRRRFERLNVFDDLTKSIDYNKEALELCPEGHLHRPASLGSLAESLLSRFSVQGTPSDLTDAIELFRETLSLRPVGHSLRSMSLLHFAVSLQRRFEQCRSVDDLNEVFELFSELSELNDGISWGDLRATRAWAESADKYNHSSTMTAYQTALNCLVRHAAIFPSSAEHYKILKANVSSLAVDAFSYCVRRGNIKTAVELLEQGRTVFWVQLARLSTPLDDLSSADTSLAGEFRRVCSRLRTLFDQESEFQSIQTRKLTAELDDIVSRIRALPDFSRFLLPPLFSDIQTAAKGGPVIIMNASQYSCDAVILLHDEDPIHVELDTSKEVFSELAFEFRKIVDKPKHFSTKDIAIVLRNVWDRAVEPVAQALQRHGVPLNSRIWWCPTSDFTFLPLHATGPFRKGQRQLSDLYVSSYTPTLGTLLRARRQAHVTADKPPFAVVGASKPLGEVPLPSVTPELALVAERVRDSACVTHLADEDATIERATDAFKRCKWLHLACHGIPNAAQPFQSSFALHDGHLTLGKLVQSDFESPDFAFLSACRTTVGDATTPDEVIHLAASMQFGGFRSVIGTILPVDDATAGKVVSAFYRELLDGPESDRRLECTGAAAALHRTLKSLRREIPFDQQIAFVHIGV